MGSPIRERYRMDTRTDLDEIEILKLYSGYKQAYYQQVRRKDVQNKHSIRRRYLFCLWRILLNNKLL